MKDFFATAGLISAACAGLVAFAAPGMAQTQPAMAPASAGNPRFPAVVRDEPEEKQAERLKWFREARFGMFIHWGVYAVPAGFYQGKPVSAEWIMHRGKIPVAEYKAMAKEFTAAKYDPQAWAALAKEAGMKYVDITAKHHDGFTLFDSKVSDWNAVKSSPAGRDLIAPLAEAVRAQGLKFGTYYSQAQDWVNPGGSTGLDPRWDAAQEGSMDDYLKNVALPQVQEIMEKFKPDILWWDTEYQMTPERARPFFDLVLSHPNLIHNSRLGGGVLGDFRTSEQRIPGAANTMTGRALEVNMTINGSWGYRSDDVAWKSQQQLIRNLSDVASLGGNYLLNVGPTKEGEIPEPCVERLRAMGRWLSVNGEAIYATQRGPFATAPAWGRATQKINPDGSATLYLHVWDWPANGKLTLPTLKQAPTRGRLLASGAAVESAAGEGGVVVTLPGAAPDKDVSVVALDFPSPVPIEAPPATAPARR